MSNFQTNSLSLLNAVSGYASDNTVTEINASSRSVVGTIGVGRSPVRISSDGRHVWVANSADNTVSEIAIKASQTVIFTSTNPSPVVVGAPSYTPAATGGASTIPVIISLDGSSTGCTLTAGVVQFTTVGTCVLDANQAGDANYLPAPEVPSPSPSMASRSPRHHSRTPPPGPPTVRSPCRKPEPAPVSVHIPPPSSGRRSHFPRG